MTYAEEEKLIQRLALRMKEDAATGLTTRILKQINFRSLAISVVDELRKINT